jgi:ABC-type transport system involved in multi-copper enzyme maturation permease subunit
MKNIWLITWYTVREAMARKVFIFFLGISALTILLSAAFFGVVGDNSFINGAVTTGNTSVLKDVVSSLELMILSPLSALCIMISIFSCASFVPNMLEKGNIDLLLSKPISRLQLILGKYFGGLLVVLMNITFLIVGIWIVVSVKFSYWNFNFLSLILVITFTFAVLYALIVWFGIMTRSATPGMMVAYLIYIILSPLLFIVKDKGEMFIHNEFVYKLVKNIYYIFPKTTELMNNISNNLATGRGILDYQPVYSSFLFLCLMLFLSVFMFNKKDY